VITSLPSAASLLEVADELAAGDIGVLVVGGPDRVVGVVSERDLVRALAARRDPAVTRAVDVANTDLLWCDNTATIGEVARKMKERYVRHLLVEEDGRLVGVVSARDLLGAYATADLNPLDDNW
jgi:CBS domain-containing protein